MIKLGWASIRGHWVRFVMTAVAVALGVAFVTGSLALSDNMNRTFGDIISRDSLGKDVVVAMDDGEGNTAGMFSRGGSQAKPLPLTFADKLAAVDGAKSATAEIQGSAILVSKENKITGNGGAPNLAFPAVPNDPAIDLQDGKIPTKNTEVAVETNTLKKSGHAVGDKVDVIIAGDRKQFTIVGKVGLGNMAGATGVAFDQKTAEKLFAPEGVTNSFRVEAKPGVTQEALLAQIKPLVPEGYVAKTGAENGKKQKNMLTKQLRPFTIFMLVFAFVALIVGSFIIVNTFLMILAQRSRELAMLRAIGTKPRQILQMVMFEAVVIAVAGALLGLLFGLGIAFALVWFLATQADLELSYNIPITPTNIAVSVTLGLVVTLGAALIPAVKASRTAPIEAMRSAQTTERSPLKARMVVGLALLVVGGLGFGIYQRYDNSGWLSMAAIGFVAGTVAIAPGLVKPLMQPLAKPLAAIQKAFRRPTAVTNLAQDNTIRNPRRTSLTATSLLIGVALVTGSAVMATGLSKSMASDVTKSIKAPLSISVGEGGAPEALMDKLSSTDGVDAVVPLTTGSVSTDLAPKDEKNVRKTPDGQVIPENVRLQGVPSDKINEVFNLKTVSGSLKEHSRDAVLVDKSTAEDFNLSVGSTFTMGPDKDVKVKVAGIFEDIARLSGVVTTPDVAEKLLDPQSSFTSAVYILPKAGADVATVKTALTEKVKDLLTIKVSDKADLIKSDQQEIQQFLAIIYALLGLSIVIAALGIANTLAMAIYERTREIGMLRALGLKRRQLGGMVILESMWTAVFGALLGVVLGMPLGVITAEGLFEVSAADVGIPWLTMIGVVIAAAVVGVIAALVPAIRATRMKVLDSIAAV